MKKAFLTLGSMFVVFLFSAGAVHADTFIIQPGPEDGQDTGYDGGSNYPDSDTVPIGGWGGPYHDLLKFSLDGAPDAASTVSAKLRIWGVRPGDSVAGHDPELQMHRNTSGWDEATANWYNAPSDVFYKTMPVTLPSNNSYGWVEIDITDLYKGWQNGTYLNYGVKLIPLNVNKSNGNIFASENTDIAHRPQIIVTTNITEVNQPPVLNPIGNKTVIAGQQLQFTVTATDPDEGQSVTLLASNLPSGATFNPQTGLFSWVPTVSAIGTYEGIEFIATDTGHPSVDTSEIITVTVTPVPDITAPVAAPSQKLAANGDMDVNWNWSDDAGGSGINSLNCTFSDIAPNVEGAILNATCEDVAGNIGSASYVVRTNITEIQPGPEDGQDTSHSGGHTTPDDETLNSGGWGNQYIDLFKFNLGTAPAADVTDAVEFWFWGSRPPDSVSGHDPALDMYRVTSNWSEGTTEGGNDPSAVFYKTLPVMMPSDGTKGWVKTDITDLYKAWQDGTYPNYGMKLFPLNVNKSNGSIFASENRDIAHRPKLVIQHVNAPTNQAPILDPIGAKTANEGVLLQFTVNATDPDTNDLLAYSASNLPSGATFNPTTRTFSWTPSFTQEGNYENIEFTVSDNGSPMELDVELITITIGNVNRAPVLDAIAPQEVLEEESVAFTVSATDPDLGTFTLSAFNLPTGASFNAATGAFSWTPTLAQAGSYVVTFQATDTGSPVETGTADVVITVGDNPTPTEQTEVIIDTVTDYNLPTNIENSYMANLKKVVKFIEEGKIQPAINQLNAFKTKVEADYVNGVLTQAQRNNLIALANALLADLQ